MSTGKLLCGIRSEAQSCAAERRTVQVVSSAVYLPDLLPFLWAYLVTCFGACGFLFWNSSGWLEQLSRGHSEASGESPVTGCFTVPAGLVLNSSHHRLVRGFAYR